MHVALMYSGRILNGSTRVTQHLAASRFERSQVFIIFVSCLNFLFIFFFKWKKPMSIKELVV